MSLLDFSMAEVSDRFDNTNTFKPVTILVSEPAPNISADVISLGNGNVTPLVSGETGSTYVRVCVCIHARAAFGSHMRERGFFFF